MNRYFLGLNENTILDANPKDLIVKLAGAKIYNKLGLLKGYWQVPMNAKHVTMLSTPISGIYCVSVL